MTAFLSRVRPIGSGAALVALGGQGIERRRQTRIQTGSRSICPFEDDYTADDPAVNRGNFAPSDDDEEGPEWDADACYDFGDFDEEEDEDDA